MQILLFSIFLIFTIIISNGILGHLPLQYSHQLMGNQQDNQQVAIPTSTANMLLLQQQQQQQAQFYKPEVKLQQGLVRGTWIKSSESSDKSFLAFLGIPYAAPPVGPLRFKSPRPHPGWLGQILECGSFRSACPQYDARGSILGQEDCLYLNIYIPGNINTKQQQPKYPVMIFIQGESFENGDSAIYGPEKLIDSDVILVTFNYRVGILGFVSTGDDIISGNMGLKDQYMALEWIQQNINHFMGDTNKITIFGQGSGAASVLYQIISPRNLSGQLFQRAIAQSGSPLCSWALERDPNQYFQSIAQQIGCLPPSPLSMVQLNSIWSNIVYERHRLHISDYLERLQNSSISSDLPVNRQNNQLQLDTMLNSYLADCLRAAPLDQLLQAQTRVKILSQFPQRNAPVIEPKHVSDAMIIDEPRQTLTMGNFNHVPLIVGSNKNEGAFFYPAIVNSYNAQKFSAIGGKTLDSLENDLVDKLLESATEFKSLHPINLIMTSGNRRNAILNGTSLKVYNEARNQVKETIQYSYFNSVDHFNLTQVAMRFINMSSDALYGSCLDETLKLYSRHGLGRTSTYMYVFDYMGQNSMVNLITHNAPLLFNTGVCHGDELFYLFSLNSDDVKPLTTHDQRISQRLTRLWTDFAKYGGAPAFDNYEYPRWPNFDPDSLSYLRIGTHLLPDRSYQQIEANFWSRHLYKVYEEAKVKSTSSTSELASPGDDSGLRISTYSQHPMTSTTAYNQNVREVETFTPYLIPYDKGSSVGYGAITNGKLTYIQPDSSTSPYTSNNHKNMTSVTNEASSFFGGERPLNRRMSQINSHLSYNQLEQNRLKEQQVIISSFAYTMVGTSISLLIIVVILLIVLYKQRKRQTFKTASPSTWLEASNSVGSHYFHYPPTSPPTVLPSTPDQGHQSSLSVRPNTLMLY